MTTAMIDDLVRLEAPEGTHAISITFHLDNEAHVLQEAQRHDAEVIYLPSESDRQSVCFWVSDVDSVTKTYVSKADPR